MEFVDLRGLIIDVFLPDGEIPDYVFDQATECELVALTSDLSRAERIIFNLVHYEEITLWEIGEALDLSAAMVTSMYNAIHANIAHSLRAIGVR